MSHDAHFPIPDAGSSTQRHPSLTEQVQAAFGTNGLLSGMPGHFHVREGQTEMALAVARQIEQGGSLVIEAGTGVGKTYAYLVPALMSGERVLLSTATKALQDQLFARDLPALIDALGIPIRLALLKGRSNYLCTHRMRQHMGQEMHSDRNGRAHMSIIVKWAQQTQTGDLAEVDGLDDRSPALPMVTSSRDNCLGSNCPDFRSCHVMEARRKAMAADVVVVNHHLFFADMAVREASMTELLPAARVIVFDEAHQLNETGVAFLGKDLSSSQLIDLRRDVLIAGLQMARGLVDWNGLCSGLEKATRDWRLALPQQIPGGRLGWDETSPLGCHPQLWQQVMQDVGVALSLLISALDSVSEIAPDFVRLYERANELALRVDQFLQPAEAAAVRWVEASGQIKCIESPLDIADAFRKELNKAPASTSEEALPKTWIFTSATLGDEPSLNWFTEPIGLTGATIMRVASPFDYSQQALLHIPAHLPKPLDPNHSLEVAKLAAEGARRLGGRTLVLTTSLKALSVIGEEITKALSGASSIEVLVQGQWPKRRLMERFRQGSDGDAHGCVLVASASFWEGFDVPGQALQLLIIDKLPFPSPGDPLVKARGNRLQAQGKSAFSGHSLPEAIVALKQGAGRLIRHETDRGGLLIADNRLLSATYGRRILAALPVMRQIDQTEDFWNALVSITTVSTTAS
jgi:ATP-dependent DNA helicase DinG